MLADDVQLTFVGEGEYVKAALSSATTFVIGEFEQNDMTAFMKPSKFVMLITNWRAQFSFLCKLKRKVALHCNRKTKRTGPPER